LGCVDLACMRGVVVWLVMWRRISMPVECGIDFFGCGWVWLLVLLLGHFIFGL
jgi:hypothetical protein